MRKQFNLQDWLKDESQKIETRNGRPAHYIGLDRAGWQVFEIFRANGTSEYTTYHDSYLYDGPGESTYDLFIVTPEPELTEFEIHLLDWLSSDTSGEIPMERMKEVVRNRAKELLSLAREQLIKEGYVIEKKAYHDAVEKVDPEVMKDVSENVDAMMEEALRLEYEKGRADALKDMPRWRYAYTLIEDALEGLRHPGLHYTNEDCLVIIPEDSNDAKCILLKDLKKLPGFKEDEK